MLKDDNLFEIFLFRYLIKCLISNRRQLSRIHISLFPIPPSTTSTIYFLCLLLVSSRFTPEEKAKRNPYDWLPFGSGPRSCIGMRLALSEIKVSICYILRNYKLLRGIKTEVIELSVKYFVFPFKIT